MGGKEGHKAWSISVLGTLVGKRILDLKVVCSCKVTIHPFVQSTALN